MSADEPVASPCNKICVLDPATQQCIGCQRTLAEIVRWSELSEGERASIVAELPARWARFEAAKARRDPPAR